MTSNIILILTVQAVEVKGCTKICSSKTSNPVVHVTLACDDRIFLAYKVILI